MRSNPAASSSRRTRYTCRTWISEGRRDARLAWCNGKEADMPNYAQVLARHLADYKSTRLGLKEDGAFVYRGKEVLHGHIIPVTQPKWLNILEPVRADVQKY